MADKAVSGAKEATEFIKMFLKWLVIAAVTGIVGGLIGSAFHLSVSYVTRLRDANLWLIWLLPAGGLIIAALYKLTKMESKNTNSIIDAVHEGCHVPMVLTPMIFVATVITHLVGGSAGREGAALQIGGGLGCGIGRLFKLDDKDERVATLCGMSAVFAALFGTPLTATFFALEVISVGLIYYAGLVPCLVASVVAYGVTRLFGIAPTRFAVLVPQMTISVLWRVGVLAIACAVVSILFCTVMHGTENLARKRLKNPYVRALTGGVLLIALTYLTGTYDYNGTGLAAITKALEAGQAAPSAFIWKIIFTAVTLSCGFKGGEVVPTFFTGAVFGCVLGPLLGLPAGFAGAIGLVAVFCGAVNCPITAILLSVELFGSSGIICFSVACGIAYMLSGYFGLYSSQKIMYSKLRAEFINIQAK